MRPQKLLLPNKYKKIGWFLLIPATLFGIIMTIKGSENLAFPARVFALIDGETFGRTQAFRFIATDITLTLVGIVFIIGGLLVGFSKEKNEDEFIMSLRLTSLLWAVLVNYGLLLFSFTFIYGTAFFSVMTYNIFTTLIIFIARFNYVLYRSNKSLALEKYN